jgi:ABC-type Na+ efflux pump permease subunit
MELNVSLRIGGALLTGIWLLGLASQAAAGICSEREQDTWISLLATPLDGAEILRGKMLGPLRATAPFGIALGAIWIIGCAAGAVHPLGLLNVIVVVLVIAWFTTSLGTFISLKSQRTWKARLWTQGILIAPHFCCLLPIRAALVLVGISLWSYAEIHELWRRTLAHEPRHFFFFTVASYFGGLAVYSGAAFFLTRRALQRFDEMADRPSRLPDDEVVFIEKEPT